MQEKQNTEKRHIDKKTIFGLLLLFFAVIGVISSAIFVTRTAIDIIDNKSDKEMYADYVYPLVVLDPPTFESTDKLDMKTMLTAGIWNLLQNEDLSKYAMDDMGLLTVPQTDVEAYTTKLFGEGIAFQHQALGDASYSFMYNTSEQVYYLPSNSIFFPYTPSVTKISKSGDTIELTVAYVPTGDLLKDPEKGKEDVEAKKTRVYVLKKLDKHEYNILAVKDPTAEASSVAAETSSAAASVASTASTATASTASAASTAPATSKAASK